MHTSIRLGAGVLAVCAATAGLACAGPKMPCSGGSGTARETFVQVENRVVTILWVIDDSASMCEEQANLRDNVTDFIRNFRSAAPTAEFHMGVVTTDTSSAAVAGRLRNDAVTITPSPDCPTPPPEDDCLTGLPSPLPKWIDETTVEAERILRCLTYRGIGGSEIETPLGAARLALSPALLNDPSANLGFYVPDSVLVIVIVADEDDCSVCNTTTCSPLPGAPSNLDCALNRAGELTPVQDFIDYFSALTSSVGVPFVDSGLLVASIIGHDLAGSSTGPLTPDPGGADALVPICSGAGTGTAAPAPRIEAFTRGLENYLELSLCDADYGESLAEIGQSVAATLNSACLQSPPCPGATSSDVIVRVTDEGVTTALAPDVDYAIECGGAAAGTAPCTSENAECPEGWRIRFLTTVPPGGVVEVLYAFDSGDGCIDACPAP